MCSRDTRTTEATTSRAHNQAGRRLPLRLLGMLHCGTEQGRHKEERVRHKGPAGGGLSLAGPAGQKCREGRPAMSGPGAWQVTQAPHRPARSLPLTTCRGRPARHAARQEEGTDGVGKWADVVAGWAGGAANRGAWCTAVRANHNDAASQTESPSPGCIPSCTRSGTTPAC